MEWGLAGSKEEDIHTNCNQPNQVLQPDNGQNGQAYPQRRHDVHAQPEEAFVGLVIVAGALGRGLEDPVTVARRGVDFIPPSQSDQAPAGDVLEVVEVDGQEEQGQDEDEDEVADE